MLMVTLIYLNYFKKPKDDELENKYLQYLIINFLDKKYEETVLFENK